MQRIPQSSCARKVMVEIDNLITSRAHDKNYEKYKNSEWTSQENEDLELV